MNPNMRPSGYMAPGQQQMMMGTPGIHMGQHMIPPNMMPNQVLEKKLHFNLFYLAVMHTCYNVLGEIWALHHYLSGPWVFYRPTKQQRQHIAWLW